METWDLYNIDRIKNGKTALRGEKLALGDYHNVVFGVVFNSRGEMLIQRRSPDRIDRPHLWDLTVGGSEIAGENSRGALEREIFEELGIVLDMSGKRPALTMNFSPAFLDFYIIREDIDVDSLTYQAEEVCDARYATEEEILEMLKRKEFSPNFKHFISLLFELKDVNPVTGVLRGYKKVEKDI